MSPDDLKDLVAEMRLELARKRALIETWKAVGLPLAADRGNFEANGYEEAFNKIVALSGLEVAGA